MGIDLENRVTSKTNNTDNITKIKFGKLDKINRNRRYFNHILLPLVDKEQSSLS